MQKSRANQIIHGLPNKPRYKEPSMFQILAWDNGRQSQLNDKQNKVMTNENNQQINEELQIINKYTPQKNTFTHNSRKIQHNLYLYGDQEQKTKRLIHQASQKMIKNQNIAKKVKISQRTKSKSLNPYDSNDLAQIKQRKKKIKNFKLFSRELPDSAFTTYFGKPAFSNYGIGSKSAQKKTFNIMPHAGSNHPENQQSYETALVKAKQIKQTIVPKKPMQIYHSDEYNMHHGQDYMIPIKKPNLINTLRFSQDKTHLQRKGKTPKHNDLNHIPSRQSFQSNCGLKNSKVSQGKLKKVKSMKTFQDNKNDHPLVQSRDHLRQILSDKKRQQNRLAYKVTECYPLPYQNSSKQCETKASRWMQMKPAGIVSPRSDHVEDLLHINNIWS